MTGTLYLESKCGYDTAGMSCLLFFYAQTPRGFEEYHFMEGARNMTKKWKHKKRPKPRTGPTRGKYRQMWKAQIRDMVPGEEEISCDEAAVRAVDFGGYGTARAA